MEACNSFPTCKSFNLALSKPGEWYCEPTEYGTSDTAFAVPQEEAGFDNYAFMVSRVQSHESLRT